MVVLPLDAFVSLVSRPRQLEDKVVLAPYICLFESLVQTLADLVTKEKPLGALTHPLLRLESIEKESTLNHLIGLEVPLLVDLVDSVDVSIQGSFGLSLLYELLLV